MVQCVAGFVGDNATNNGTPGQPQVSDQVHNFVTHTFIGITESCFEWVRLN